MEVVSTAKKLLDGALALPRDERVALIDALSESIERVSGRAGAGLGRRDRASDRSAGAGAGHRRVGRLSADAAASVALRPISRRGRRRDQPGGASRVPDLPSLRNVAETRPWFHDGSVESLEEAIRLMARHPLDREFTRAPVRALVSFLSSLSAEDVPPWAYEDWGRRRGPQPRQGGAGPPGYSSSSGGSKRGSLSPSR